ncbi:hypothetical protein [Planomicrobium okeanokoites]|uniref:hypothetical protein n=1 Tax=Planomicrobium okeanokoites TaxID=244 RepID=UPI000A011B44|nr:hypothetical protein [Planomicrobium okeanokoites]
MEFKLGSGTLMLPALHVMVMAVIIIYLLVKWSKQLETRQFTVYFYFLISAYIMPIYSSYSDRDGEFQIMFPIGFVVVFFYLFRSERYHTAKMKACFLGLAIACYQIIRHYIG